ncbi:hypothetical protein AAG906_025810 [Vitis piasezkii]
MQFSGEMNIYRESELSGDFEGEIGKKRIKAFRILDLEEKMSSLTPHPECENHYH